MAEQFGGGLVIEPQVEQGAKVTLTLALNMIQKRQQEQTDSGVN